MENFRGAIQKGRSDLDARRRLKRLQEEKEKEDDAKAESNATYFIESIVLPRLQDAAKQLEEDGLKADVGNGRTGNTIRRSLTIRANEESTQNWIGTFKAEIEGGGRWRLSFEYRTHQETVAFDGDAVSKTIREFIMKAYAEME